MMNDLFRKTPYLLLAASIALVTACSSGGGDDVAGVTYSGNTSPAVIDDTNAEALGKAAGESVQVADASTNLPGGITTTNNTAPVDMTEINNAVIAAANALNLPTGIDVSAGICSSGTASATDPGQQTTGPLDFTITFSNCVLLNVVPTTTINGTVIVHYDDINDPSSNFTFTYRNLTVTNDQGVHTINMTMSCTTFGSCTFNSDFVGTDGTVHRISEFNIFGDAVNGYNGTAIFFHSTFGEINITVSNITYGSCASVPDGGTIIFNSTNGSSGTVIFNGDCTVSGTWNNGAGGTGSF